MLRLTTTSVGLRKPEPSMKNRAQRNILPILLSLLINRLNLYEKFFLPIQNTQTLRQVI
jgi:hypothetical protein